MMMFSSLANVVKIPDLRRKILITLGIIIVYRIGIYIPVPGVNVDVLKSAASTVAQSDSPFAKAFAMVDLFVGGALQQCSIFFLGVMPYISASIIFQLLTAVVPKLEELAKEGEAGRRRIRQYERYATVAICLVQAYLMVRGFFYSPRLNLVPPEIQGFTFDVIAVMSIAAGSMLLMWLGEQIDEYGIGNGISLIIMFGIVDRLIPSFHQIWESFSPSLANPEPGKIGIGLLVILIVLFVGVVVGVILMTLAQRRVPVQQAKHMRGRRIFGGQRHYLPLRVNQAGVIPIIFASALLQFLAMGGGFIAMIHPMLKPVGDIFAGARLTFFYNIFYVGMIFFFCYFYTAIIFNPIKMADEMKEYGSFVPGIRPGRKTSEYLEFIMTRITLAGATFLALIAIFPNVIAGATPALRQKMITGFYGGTGVLIVVGVALDLVQKIETQLMMRNYEGFLAKGRIHGRRG
ncbi:MAG: preprotein translocase subunit SecY [Planctomycetota bacterium]